jgi:Protein of unknown function (DUF2934)
MSDTTEREFFSEDDLQTFEGWLKYQRVDPTTPPEELQGWRPAFEEARARTAATPKVGRMKLQPAPGQYLYAVAIEERPDLWLTLWIRRNWKGEFFVMRPRGDRDWEPHTSYHENGNLHMKSYGGKLFSPLKRQSLKGTFRGSEDLGFYAGHGGKSIGAVCDPTVFSGVVKVSPGVLGPCDGEVKVDLIEPGHEPMAFPGTVAAEQVFRDFVPWLVIRVGHREWPGILHPETKHWTSRPTSHEKIALHAYYHWERRGKPFGSPEIDWYWAIDDLSNILSET